jgi:hypothetical protein
MAFTTLVLAQLFNCFNARSAARERVPPPVHQPALWGAIALSALLQVAVVHVPALNEAFGTTPLTAAGLAGLRRRWRAACCGRRRGSAPPPAAGSHRPGRSLAPSLTAPGA